MGATSKLFIASYIILTLTSGCTGKTDLKEKFDLTNRTPRIFRQTSPAITGVTFENTLTEGLNTNILMYEYFYNGGGVAAGDFNGDGYLDLYFSSNMGENKLYLNQGGKRLTYQDATQKSGVSGRVGPWKTGVNAIDINGDGKLDIYVCYSGALPEEKRQNQLFINQGNNSEGVPIFQEQATAYGLASNAFSNQSYFFDYDKDGDLDMLLLNHNPRNLPILNETQTAELLKTDDPMKGVRLFEQQEPGKFKDVTIQVGISSSELTYGLGLGISDLNDDGWPDFYISNDYAVPDYLYMNNQDGTFSNSLETSLGHSSQFSMGNDVADINNDGLVDIITLDMLPEDNRRQKLLLAPDNYNKFDHNVRSGFYYQYMRNMLQLNNGNGTYSEIGQLAGISNTDWSWAALAADYDNDGWKDLYVTNGYHRDYTNLDFIHYMEDFVEKRGRLKREDVLEIIQNMPSSDVPNYIYSGSDRLRFTDMTSDWGLYQVANSNGAVYADLDNDGDLDLVVNNINQKAFVYENLSSSLTDYHYLQVALAGEGTNTYGIGAKVSLYAGDRQQVLEQYPSRGYLSSVSPVLHFGLGTSVMVDSLVVEWTSGKREKRINFQADDRIILDERDALFDGEKHNDSALPVFKKTSSPVSYTNPKVTRRDFDRQTLLISELSCSGPGMVKGDLNGDGLEDLFIGGAAGQSAVTYLQNPDGSFSYLQNPAFNTDKENEDTDAAIFDANGDGHQDLYVTSGGYHLFEPADPLLQDRLYLNDGSGRFTKATNALPALLTSASCVVTLDVNQDGAMDLFIGGRVVPGRYPEAPGSYLLVGDGAGHFKDETPSLAPDLSKYGMVTDAVWTDLNQDGKGEMIVVGEWLPVSVFENVDGEFKNKTSDYFDALHYGFWNTVEIADINQDKQPDLVVGNSGTNLQFKASFDQPAELYYADFDQNGSVDPIFCYHIQGRSYPYVTRDELLRQMVSFRSKYTSYERFANVTIQDLFSGEQLEQAGYLKINQVETSLFLSQEDNRYLKSELPVETQFAPVYTIDFLDYNADGHIDLLLCGNNSRLKLRLGKSDANYGILLKGDGKGGFTYINQVSSGLNLIGDVRGVVQFGELFLFGRNQLPLEAYELNKKLLKQVDEL